MRQCAVAIATALVFAMTSPAFAQPFADTPTNHWAYDAIAELAAKGLIEGYPDGTFKGDRAMTRYEMAMVVARLLARIESIQIPSPTPQIRPEVGRSDVDTILRLVNEFRAELAAKNVRLTAVEEELNAIKAKLDNVKIVGRFRWRYDGGPAASGAALNGNPATGVIDASKSATLFRAREGFKLVMDGSASPDVHAIFATELASCQSSTPLTFNSGNFGAGANGTSCGGSGSPQYTFANIVNLFFDWKNVFGYQPLELWIGRFGRGVQGFQGHGVQMGPFGLLLNTNTDTWGASTQNLGTEMVDGLRLAGHWPDVLDLQIQGLVARVAGPIGGSSYSTGEDAFAIDANVSIFPGLRVGADYVSNNIGPSPGIAGAPNANYHVYGNPGTPGTNPVTAASIAVPGCVVSINAASNQNGIACPAAGSGYGVYAMWDVWPGIHLDGEGASWSDSVHSTSDSGFQVNATFDLGTMLGTGRNLTAQAGYVYMGTNFYPPYGVEADDFLTGSVFPGNAQGFQGQISFDAFSNFTLLGLFFTGNNVSNTMNITEWQAGFIWSFAPATSLWVRWETQTMGGITQYTLYRAEMNYTF